MSKVWHFFMLEINLAVFFSSRRTVLFYGSAVELSWYPKYGGILSLKVLI